MIPIIIFGICIGFILVATKKENPEMFLKNGAPTRVQGNTVDLTPHLSEFTRLIRRGHKPSSWLVTEAINDAYRIGNWRLVRSITDNYSSPIEKLQVKKKINKESPKKEEVEEIEEKPQLFFQVQKTTSPIEGINDDDWRMFVEASRIEQPNFGSNSSYGMFRQNKKRAAKLGIEATEDPVKQYEAFEKEVQMLMDEGKDVFKQSVAMPLDVDGENTAMTLSGLLAVMRHAGTANATKWIDSPDERKKFPHTTEAFKKANGCF